MSDPGGAIEPRPDAEDQEADAAPALDRDRPWHRMPADDVIAALDSDRSWLSSQEADRRLQRIGRNSIQQDVEVSRLKVLIDQFTSPLIYVLLASLAITLLIQRWSDATVIGLVLVVNATVGYLQDYRGENAIKALMEMLSPKAVVRREGEERRIESDRIVPGDVVLLSEGDIVPADMRLFDARRLHVNEAALTGESVPASKSAGAMADADADLPPAEIENMLFMGTAVTSGRASALVVATGTDTQVGDIAEGIRSAETRKTPLQRRIDRLAKALDAVTWGVATLLAFSIIIPNELHKRMTRS